MMKKRQTSRLGFTLIELLLVIGLVAIVGASGVPFLSRFIQVNNLDTTENNLVSVIRKAQGYGMNNKSNVIWGVCLSGGNIRLYGGSCGSPSYSEDYNVASTIAITGLTDVSFDRRGRPSSAQNIQMDSDIESAVVSVNEMGGVSYE